MVAKSKINRPMISVLENQHGAVSKARQNPRHRDLEAHGCNRLRHHEQARLNRCEPEANLIQERKKKWDATNAKASQEAAAHCRAKRAKPKEDKIQHRIGGFRRVKCVARKQENGNRQKTQNFPYAQRVLAKHFQHV